MSSLNVTKRGQSRLPSAGLFPKSQQRAYGWGGRGDVKQATVHSIRVSHMGSSDPTESSHCFSRSPLAEAESCNREQELANTSGCYSLADTLSPPTPGLSHGFSFQRSKPRICSFLSHILDLIGAWTFPIICPFLYVSFVIVQHFIFLHLDKSSCTNMCSSMCVCICFSALLIIILS